MGIAVIGLTESRLCIKNAWSAVGNRGGIHDSLNSDVKRAFRYCAPCHYELLSFKLLELCRCAPRLSPCCARLLLTHSASAVVSTHFPCCTFTSVPSCTGTSKAGFLFSPFCRKRTLRFAENGPQRKVFRKKSLPSLVRPVCRMNGCWHTLSRSLEGANSEKPCT